MKRILTPEEKRELARINRIDRRHSENELRLTPGFQTHAHLLKIMKKLPSDFKPYGKRGRDSGGSDCSCGCKWYHVLDGQLRSDWGVCANPRSPRCGLLTFEHQGCPKFKLEPRWSFPETPKGKRLLKRFFVDKDELRRWCRAHVPRRFWAKWA
jgi:hypothetical protein